MQYANPKKLIQQVEEVYLTLKMPELKRDRLHNHLMKTLRNYLVEDFKNQFPQFDIVSNSERVQNFSEWVTQYAKTLFKQELDAQLNKSMYSGEWGGVEFVLGCLISRNTMKQMITSSREKAYFYGFHKSFKNTSQKKLAVILKNYHLVYLIQYLFESNKIRDVLQIV